MLKSGGGGGGGGENERDGILEMEGGRGEGKLNFLFISSSFSSCFRFS